VELEDPSDPDEPELEPDPESEDDEEEDEGTDEPLSSFFAFEGPFEPDRLSVA
jgi:hypothetical protein